LFISSPIRQRFTISIKAFEGLLTLSLALAAATVVLGATCNFKLVSLGRIYEFRGDLVLPALLNYLTGITRSCRSPLHAL
jgi:hypothetical protein